MHCRVAYRFELMLLKTCWRIYCTCYSISCTLSCWMKRDLDFCLFAFRKNAQSNDTFEPTSQSFFKSRYKNVQASLYCLGCLIALFVAQPITYLEQACFPSELLWHVEVFTGWKHPARCTSGVPTRESAVQVHGTYWFHPINNSVGWWNMCCLVCRGWRGEALCKPWLVKHLLLPCMLCQSLCSNIYHTGFPLQVRFKIPWVFHDFPWR